MFAPDWASNSPSAGRACAVANLLGTGDIFELNILGFIVAVIAAVALVGVAEGLAGRRNSSR